jgi:hypothetical protein
VNEEDRSHPPAGVGEQPDPEQPAAEQPGPVQPDDQTDPTGPAESTGNPDVDDVVASLEQLDGMPVSEHVAVFEAAHEKLRGALADAGNDGSGA